MKHPHVMRYVRERPWAILPGALEAIVEILESAELGLRSDEEIRAAILQARADRGGERDSTTLRVGTTAIVPIYGVIMPRASMFEVSQSGTSLEELRSELNELVDDSDVKSIVLDINSPGGSVELLTETANEIRAMRAKKPIVAAGNGMVASAAYHLAAQASEFFATPSGLVGSVGVYSTHQDLSEKQRQAGVKTTFIQTSKRKTEGNPFEPLSEDTKAHIQTLVDGAFDAMVADVAAGRRVSEGDVRGERFGQGRVYPAAEAVRRGMADGVQSFDQTVSALLSNGVSGRADPAIAPAVPAATEEELLDQSRAALAELNPTFSDAVEDALRAIEAVVSDSEALRVLSRRKREELRSLGDRLESLLIVTEPATDAGDKLEGAFKQSRAALEMGVK